MEIQLIKTQIEIAICLLGSSRTDGYGNGRITHQQRDFIAQTITNLLEQTIHNLDQKVNLIIPKKSTLINPPDEP
jgi:hypothetical protein